MSIPKINRFDGDYRFLSNFYPCKIVHDGIEYSSTEHAFQASKSMNLDIRMMIAGLNTPGQSKRKGRDVNLRPDWEAVRISVMRQLQYIKYSIPEFREKLYLTGKARLIEGNTWHDNFWGECYCPHCMNIQGNNNLGLLLEEVRASIHANIQWTLGVIKS